jgi:alpha-galactosidase
VTHDELIIGVQLTPEQVRENEESMRQRIKALHSELKSVVTAIVWFKTRNPDFKTAETSVLEAHKHIGFAADALKVGEQADPVAQARKTLRDAKRQ